VAASRYSISRDTIYPTTGPAPEGNRPRAQRASVYCGRTPPGGIVGTRRRWYPNGYARRYRPGVSGSSMAAPPRLRRRRIVRHPPCPDGTGVLTVGRAPTSDITTPLWRDGWLCSTGRATPPRLSEGRPDPHTAVRSVSTVSCGSSSIRWPNSTTRGSRRVPPSTALPLRPVDRDDRDRTAPPVADSGRRTGARTRAGKSVGSTLPGTGGIYPPVLPTTMNGPPGSINRMLR
jgi:hypothetical protein